MGKVKNSVFINYRWTDSAGYAGRISDRLKDHFGKDAVFMDVDTIGAGLDFVKELQNGVQCCDVLVVLIGHNWLNTKDENGKRRLDNPKDFVRIEIGAALNRDIRVIPVLVDGASMPRSTELPNVLKLLALRRALQVNHDSFDADAQRLIDHLELALKEAGNSKVFNSRRLPEEHKRKEKETRETGERKIVERREQEERARLAAGQQDRREREDQKRWEAQKRASVAEEEQQQHTANKAVSPRKEGDELFVQAQKAELSGELEKALNLYYEVKRLDPFYPRIDRKIEELEQDPYLKSSNLRVWWNKQTNGVKKVAYIIGIFTLITALLGGGGLLNTWIDNSPPPPTPTMAIPIPTINIPNRPCKLAPGESLPLAVTGVSGSSVTYRWSASRGNVTPSNGPSVLYTAPNMGEDVIIKVEVKKDGQTLAGEINCVVLTDTPSQAQITEVMPLPSEVVFQNEADRLADLQNDDGGWDWPLDDGNPAKGSLPSTVGPIAKGLAEAYVYTSDPDHAAALQAVGAFLLAKTNTFSPPDGYLAAALDKIFGGTTYTDHVMTYFYGPLAAGTYDRNGTGTLYDTAGYVNWIRTTRASQGNPNLAAWDIGMGLVGAAAAGADTTAWIAGVKAEIDELDGSADYDVIGLAGAIYGLAHVGEDHDPVAGEHASAGSLADLGMVLAGYQLATGGFTWNSYDLEEG